MLTVELDSTEPLPPLNLGEVFEVMSSVFEVPVSVVLFITGISGVAGAVTSYVTLNWVAAVLSSPKASCATPASTSMLTVPSPDGVISAVYVVPEPAKLPADPLVTSISPTTKPVTDSLKVIVTENGEELVGLLAPVVIVVEG